jgi:hypothetical protein
MSFGAPLFAWVGGAVAVAVVALHLLAWRRPPTSPLPTARFAPEAPVRTVSRAVRPADRALLALRVLLILLVSAALAGPRVPWRAQGIGRVIVVDRSDGPNAWAAIDRAARSAFRSGDAVVLFDSAARQVRSPTVDSIVATTSSEPGSMSAALVVAIRAAKELQRVRDSVEIVVVSPFRSDELDAATASIRRVWPGTVRAMRVRVPPNDTTRTRPLEIRAGPGDAVGAALALAGNAAVGAVRVIRGPITPADTAWARQGGAVVAWPVVPTPQGWQTRAAADTAFGVTVTSALAAPPTARGRPATVVAPFVRRASVPPGRVVARWDDGEPAATEITLGAGCVRSVAVTVPSTGDLALTPAFRRFAEQLARPCASGGAWMPVPDSLLSTVLPAPGVRDSAVRRFGTDAPRSDSRIAAWILGAAMAAALAELLVRRGAVNATA